MFMQDLESQAAGSGLTTVFVVLGLVWLVLVLAAGWKMYVKAAQPGWVAVIPFLNVFGLLKIVHRPLWWFILLVIPIVNIVAAVLIFGDLSKAFGRGPGHHAAADLPDADRVPVARLR